jgi:Zn-dependent protease
MLGGGSLTLFRIRGIRIAVDWSWFVILFFLIYAMSKNFGDALGKSSGDIEPFGLAVASALGFFGSILLHELGHAFAARRRGIGILSIQLWIFGGIARMDRESDSPRSEFEVAAAGPAVTFAIVVVLAIVGAAATGLGDFGHFLRLALEFKTEVGTSGLLLLVSWLGAINAFVLVFNLLPAFPMDGGRIARALIWWRTGDRHRATRIAANMGRVFGYLFVGGGFLLIVSGDAFSGIWLGLIGFLVSSAAQGAAAQTEITSKIGAVRVADVMDRQPVAIPGEISIERALDEYFLRYRWPWFPVVDAAHRFLGLLERDQADDVPEVSRASANVSDIVDPDTGFFIRDDTPLDALLGNQNLRKLGALMAVDSEGHLSGVITIEQVGRALRDATAGA